MVALALIAAGIVLFFRTGRTPPIPDPGEAEPVASLERVELGGDEQWILLRGRDRTNPVLLFLHGGPGMPAMYLAHAFQRPLERDFVVVHWDRLGAGKSYGALDDPSELAVSRLLADARELVAHLRRRFGEERVYLVGHSWGSYLGMLLVRDRPSWFHAFVGVGQVTWPDRELALADSFIVAEARRKGTDEALAEMADVPGAHREQWLFRFGAELHDARSMTPLIVLGLRAPEYSLRDALNVARGSGRASAAMAYDVIREPLPDAVDSVEVPVHLFQGVRDWVSPTPLVRAYLARLRAPRKELTVFDEAAHFPFLADPDRFAREMARVREEVEAGEP